MADCTALAERMSQATGVHSRVVGWYHSHPHITVLPSHVDVQTQVCGGGDGEGREGAGGGGERGRGGELGGEGW